ncbi:similar to stage IV sporulation protein [Clostridium cavendishii DSM 21758]|uniref:Similar to stage IV sporulation protein n=1 Tax=Clostridium cavendishii DSM 21758 TaxID=1121302 RepID=A0A1M6AN31_9CLOT|nr:sporulation protein YqfD [Clostridium cavendishii]SHI37603.1 similar to stage IV sporulation protein [Clostridium cavendishii DSM 21758]
MGIKERLAYGNITVEIRTEKPEKIINMLWYKGIRAKNINKLNITTIIMEIPMNDYDKLKDITKRIDCKIKVIKKDGLAFFIYSLKRKIGIIIGILLFTGIIFVLSNYIWAIEIETNKNIPPFELRKELSEIGIKPGITKKSFNVYDLEKKIENKNAEIMWVRARIEGSTLKIKVEEKVNPPKEIVKGDNKDLISKLDGEVLRVYTSKGTAQVKSGDVVKKGQVLIKGIEGKEGFEFQTPAEGKVIANTFYERMIELQVSGKRYEKTGETKEDIYIQILNKKIYLKKAVKNFADYDKIEEKGKLVNKIVYYEKKAKEVNVNKEEEIKKAVDKLYKSTMETLDKKAKYIKNVIDVEDIGEGKIRVKVVFVVEQDIVDK